LRAPDSRFHKAALGIALAMTAVAVPLQLVTGDLAGKHIATYQPVKLAAAEAHFTTQEAAPLSIGGIPDRETRTRRWAIELPYGLSILAHGDPHAVVRGLSDVPESEWPPLGVVHAAFQVMVGCGTLMLGLVLWVVVWRLRRKDIAASRPLLRACVLASPLGLLAVEAGWTVTEVGRQPWIIHGVMRTTEAVTPMRGLVVPFVTFTLLYLVLGVIVVALLRAHVFEARDEA